MKPPESTIRTVRLSEKHRDELHGSGIDDVLIERAGIRTIADAEVRAVLGWQPTAHHWGPGLLIPFPGTDYARLKLDVPRVQNGKVVKYESPLRAPNRAYFPPGFHECAADRSQPILITEGEKKALSGMQHGFATIGLVGVWGWLQTRPKRADGTGRGARKLLPELAAFRWSERDVFVVFDSDAATKPEVRRAGTELVAALALVGAKARLVALPTLGNGKSGLDDFLVHHGATGAAKLKQLLNSERSEPSPGGSRKAPFDYADELLAQRFSGDGKWPRFGLVHWRDQFYRWVGTHYEVVAEAEFRRNVLTWLDSQSRGIRPKDASEVTECVASRVQVLGATDDPAWLGRGAGAPSDPHAWISTRNGIFDLNTNELRPHTPLWFSRIALPFDHAPDGNCPQWLAFLDEVLEDDGERIRLLQQWFGLCLTSDTRHHAILLLSGPRRSGKSTTLRVLRALVGEPNVASPRLTLLSEPFGLMGLLGKRVAICPDAHVGHGDKALGVLEILKSISGEDAVEVNRKHLPPVTVRLPVRFALAVNELPRFGDGANALLSRLLLIPYRRTFEGREDRDLERRLLTELPGIFNWAVAGLRDLCANGRFVMPDVSQGVREDFARLASPVEAFIADACRQGPHESVRRGELYAAYRFWCDDTGHSPVAREVFGGRINLILPHLATRQSRSDGGRSRVYLGLGLNPEHAGRVAGGTGGTG